MDLTPVTKLGNLNNMVKLLVTLFWIPLTISTLVLALFNFYLLNNHQSSELALNQQAKEIALTNHYEFYSELPQVLDALAAPVQAADNRPDLIRQYLNKYNSPLYPYADYIVTTSDQYGIDYRLIVSIAQCESNVCKKIPYNSYNCWGFGNAKTRFESWEHAINYVAKTLKEDYYDLGLTTPDLIMPKYVPPSVAKGGPWAKCVNQFMSEIE